MWGWKLSTYKFKIILTQGLNRQIRRMCDYLNYEVQTLKRVRIMNVKLDMPVGEYRELTKEEFSELNDLIRVSTKEFVKDRDQKKDQDRNRDSDSYQKKERRNYSK